MASQIKELSGWQFKRSDWNRWYQSKHGRPSTEIFLDLLENQLIPDPFKDKNELQVQWVAEADWEYKCEFETSRSAHNNDDGLGAESNILYELVFEGLDTYADVYLNDVKILTSKNQFTIHKVDITDQIARSKIVAKGGKNVLKLNFSSALLKGRRLERKYGKLIASNGEYSRVHVRKAQYHYGWDWGPKLLSCGPYRPIKLVSYKTARVEDVSVRSVLSDDLQKCEVKITIDVKHPVSSTASKQTYDGETREGVELVDEFDDFVIVDKDHSKDLYLKVTLFDPRGKQLKLQVVKVKKLQDLQTVQFLLNAPELWYPANYGSQPLYTTSVELSEDHVEILDKSSTKFGIRKVEAVQEPHKYSNNTKSSSSSTSFYFKINNIPIFAGGSNWIPADSLVTRVTKKDYSEWLQILLDANQIMVRVWGGGYYESDFFYEQCDKLGILVFQDLMFACAQYPCYKTFENLVRKELDSQLRRLSHFASIICIAGNNEDYVLAEEQGFLYHGIRDNKDYRDTTFPARTLYEKVFPEYVTKYFGSSIHYQPSSPNGPLANANSLTSGDVHQWNIWHGRQEKIQNWPLLAGKFVSEFGMESLPSLEISKEFITDSSELYPQSELVEFHNKAGGFERKLAFYVMENFRIRNMDDMAHWTYLTQLLQAECLSAAFKSFRRLWNKPDKRYVGGALVWQLNDCWPAASWAIADYKKRRKLGYYAIKRELQPITIAMQRNEYLQNTHQKPDSLIDETHDYRPRDYVLDIWAVNSTLRSKNVIFKYEVYEIRSGNLLHESRGAELIVEANQTTNIATDLNLQKWLYSNGKSKKYNVVICGKLISKSTKEIIARTYSWPEPLKHAKFGDSIFVQYKPYTDYIALSTNRPVKAININVKSSTKGKTIKLEDNGFDLCPFDLRNVRAEGLTIDDEIHISYYH